MKLLKGPCKCPEKQCYSQFTFDETKKFLDTFQSLSKLEQDSVLFMAWSDADGSGQRSSKPTRREFHFLGKYMKRVCFQGLLGLSSHRIDRMGAVDLRFGKQDIRPSQLTASIDAFCLIMYNSLAEPLPNKFLGVNKYLVLPPFEDFN